MSDVDKIVKYLEGTREAELIAQMEKVYNQIQEEQKAWYDRAQFFCPEGCGSCCHDFEPDLLESEVLYMAAWLIENKREVAMKVAEGEFPFDNGKTCPFHDFNNPYHCTIYNGRPSICRLFGASCARSKTGEKVWKPCKFYPAEKLLEHTPPLFHRQYNSAEAGQALGALPPAMSDIMEQVVSVSGGQETQLLREVLPQTVRRILWIRQMCGEE